MASAAILSLFLALIATTYGTKCPVAEKPSKQILCYYEGSTPIEQINLCNCTHLVFTNISSVTENFNLTFRQDVKVLEKTALDTKNLKLIFTVSLQPEQSAAVLKSETKKVDLINSISSFLSTSEFRGVELDFEFKSEDATRKDNLVSFTKDLRAILDHHRSKRDGYSVNEDHYDDFTTGRYSTEKYEKATTKKSVVKANKKGKKSRVPRESADFYYEDDDELTAALEEYLDIEPANRRSSRKKIDGEIGEEGGYKILLRLSIVPEVIAKKYDLKLLSKYVNFFTVPTHMISDSSENHLTFHPSRLMGLSDILNTDSILDLLTGLGAPKSKMIISIPAFVMKYELKDVNKNSPRSPVVGQSTMITQAKMCLLLKNGNWTVERDEDLTAPYAFSKKTWLAFEDEISTNIKAKYVLLRELAGAAIYSVDSDIASDSCGYKGGQIASVLQKNLGELSRKPRQVVLESLQEQIHDTSFFNQEAGVHLSEYRIVRVVDHAGAVHVIRKNTKTQFECSRQGYFSHPLGCNKFYRCVKFNQYSDDYTVFEYDCPAGLAFDERWEVCVWPGSLPHGAPCDGSSEIAPVPRSHYACPNIEGYFADPENCRWFFACIDHARDGVTPLTAYEFRCPFGLVFDEQKLACEWPWNVGSCGARGVVGYVKTQAGGSSSYLGTASIATGGSYISGQLQDTGDRASFATVPDYIISGGRIAHKQAGVILNQNVAGIQGVAVPTGAVVQSIHGLGGDTVPLGKGSSFIAEDGGSHHDEAVVQAVKLTEPRPLIYQNSLLTGQQSLSNRYSSPSSPIYSQGTLVQPIGQQITVTPSSIPSNEVNLHSEGFKGHRLVGVGKSGISLRPGLSSTVHGNFGERTPLNINTGSVQSETTVGGISVGQPLTGGYVYDKPSVQLELPTKSVVEQSNIGSVGIVGVQTGYQNPTLIGVTTSKPVVLEQNYRPVQPVIQTVTPRPVVYQQNVNLVHTEANNGKIVKPVVYQRPAVSLKPVFYQKEIVTPQPLIIQQEYATPKPVIIQQEVIAPKPIIYQHEISPAVTAKPIIYTQSAVTPRPVAYNTPKLIPARPVVYQQQVTQKPIVFQQQYLQPVKSVVVSPTPVAIQQEAVYEKQQILQPVVTPQPIIQQTFIQQPIVTARPVVYKQEISNPVVHQQPQVFVTPKPTEAQQPVVYQQQQYIQPKPVVYDQIKPVVQAQFVQKQVVQPIVTPKPFVVQQEYIQQVVTPRPVLFQQQPIVAVKPVPLRNYVKTIQTVVQPPKPVVYQQEIVQPLATPKPVLYQQTYIRQQVTSKPVVYQQEILQPVTPKPVIYQQEYVQPVVTPQPVIYKQKIAKTLEATKPVVYQQQYIQPVVTPKPVVYEQQYVQPVVTPKPVVYEQQYVQPVNTPKPVIYEQQYVQPAVTPKPVTKPAIVQNEYIQPIVTPQPVVYQQNYVKQSVTPKPVVIQQEYVPPVVTPKPVIYQQQFAKPVIQNKPAVYQQEYVQTVVTPKPVVYQQQQFAKPIQTKPVIYQQEYLQPVVTPKTVIQQGYIQQVSSPKPVVYQQPLVTAKPDVYQQEYIQSVVTPKPIIYQQNVATPKPIIYEQQLVVTQKPQLITKEIITPKPVVYQQQPIIVEKPTIKYYQRRPTLPPKTSVFQHVFNVKESQPVTPKIEIQPVSYEQIRPIVTQKPIVYKQDITPVVVQQEPRYVYNTPRQEIITPKPVLSKEIINPVVSVNNYEKQEEILDVTQKPIIYQQKFPQGKNLLVTPKYYGQQEIVTPDPLVVEQAIPESFGYEQNYDLLKVVSKQKTVQPVVYNTPKTVLVEQPRKSIALIQTTPRTAIFQTKIAQPVSPVVVQKNIYKYKQQETLVPIATPESKLTLIGTVQTTPKTVYAEVYERRPNPALTILEKEEIRPLQVVTTQAPIVVKEVEQPYLFQGEEYLPPVGEIQRTKQVDVTTARPRQEVYSTNILSNPQFGTYDIPAPEDGYVLNTPSTSTQAPETTRYLIRSRTRVPVSTTTTTELYLEPEALFVPEKVKSAKSNPGGGKATIVSIGQVDKDEVDEENIQVVLDKYSGKYGELSEEDKDKFVTKVIKGEGRGTINIGKEPEVSTIGYEVTSKKRPRVRVGIRKYGSTTTSTESYIGDTDVVSPSTDNDDTDTADISLATLDLKNLKVKKNEKTVIVVSQVSEANPVLIGKLAGECSCKSNKVKLRKGGSSRNGNSEEDSNRPNNDVPSRSDNNNESDGSYVDGDGYPNGRSGAKSGGRGRSRRPYNGDDNNDGDDSNNSPKTRGRLGGRSRRPNLGYDDFNNSDDNNSPILIGNNSGRRGNGRGKQPEYADNLATDNNGPGQVNVEIYENNDNSPILLSSTTTLLPEVSPSILIPIAPSSRRIVTEKPTSLPERPTGRRIPSRSKAKKIFEPASTPLFSPIPANEIAESLSTNQDSNDVDSGALGEISRKIAGAAFDRYGPGGWRGADETLQGSVDCKRPGLFRHPKYCNKFYACNYDSWKKRYTLHVFNCPVHLAYDSNIGACNWPSKGPACADDNLLV